MNQTCKEIEILLVNDGSTDKSLSIINMLAAEDDRIQVFNRENKGAGAARNFGLEQATGEYIGFADADDWVEPTMYERLYSTVTENNCDWGICNINVIQDDRPVKTRLQLKDELVDLRRNKLATLQQFMRFKYDNANWNKLFAASVLQKHNVRFDEGMTIWEDLLFNLMYLQFAGKAVVLSAPLYNYRVNSASLYYAGKWDLIDQFNMLYTGYRKAAAEKGNKEEMETFKKEMARNFYYQVIDTIVSQAKTRGRSFISVYKRVLAEIKRTNPGIFFFSKNELKGFQGFKKRLLIRRSYRLFSLLVVFASYVHKKQPARSN